jgi:hypothetical protein
MVMAHSNLYIKLMNSKKWRELRNEFIREHPLCSACNARGLIVAARCVHHLTPVETGKTDKECEDLAFSRSNLQALCYECHAAIHKAEHSHSKTAHHQRVAERMERWKAKHKRGE